MQYPNIPAFITMHLIVYSYSYQKRYWSMKLLLVQYLISILPASPRSSVLGPLSVDFQGWNFVLRTGRRGDPVIFWRVLVCQWNFVYSWICFFGYIFFFGWYHCKLPWISPPKHGRTCHLFPSASFRVANPHVFGLCVIRVIGLGRGVFLKRFGTRPILFGNVCWMFGRCWFMSWWLIVVMFFISNPV